MERLIRQRLAGDEELKTLLARFGTEPAIFYGKAIADTDTPEIFYPHIILSADKFSDAQHGVAGLLTADIICSQETIPPEPIEKFVRNLLEGVLFKAEEVFLLKWQRTEKFQEQNAERTALIIGATMTFEIYELPSGLTASPDAIQAAQIWAQRWDKNLVVVGLTDFGEIFVPSRERPALWISQLSTNLARQIYSVSFVTTALNFHIFAPGVQARREWLTAIYHALILAKAIELDDHSPMRLQAADIDFGADEIRGQLKTTWEYGIQRRFVYAHPLKNLEIEHDGKLRRYDGYLRR